MIRSYGKKITHLKENQIFVFGSNTEGRHGKGAAKIALDKYGAEYGNPSGRQGQSYAIVTKELSKGKRSISLYYIYTGILRLYIYAENHPELEFLVAYADLGRENLNGYSHKDMAKMFSYGMSIPENVLFSDSYVELINELRRDTIREG